MMQHILRVFTLAVVLALGTGTMLSQSNKWRDIHTVKKNETLYSISRDYDIAVEELMKANPETMQPGYSLKKGSTIYIPFTTQTAGNQKSVVDAAVKTVAAAVSNVQGRAVHLGVMLPLHDENGDGKRMVEYYRGVLMACDSLKKEGISVDVHAWNVPEDGNISKTLSDREAERCDLIIGPLYSKQVSALSKFVEKNDILLMIPFSINAPELYTNRHIFQVYQNQNDLTESTVRRFCEWFKDYHPVIIDCDDATSTKGAFTSALRRQLDQRGMQYNLTSLKTTDDSFAKAFSTSRQNVVVLNTARSPELLSTFAKLKTMLATHPNVAISMFGYTEWLMYADHQTENFHRFNVYVPSPYYTNLFSPVTERLQLKYRWNFHDDMMQSLPRFALTGFDHAYFFIKGLHKYGKTFDGAAGRFGYPPVQTPLKFQRVGNGGLKNTAYMFVHYLPNHTIETINY